MLIAVLALIVVLGVLVFIHEAGHFIAAKWAGIYVHRFSLGFGSPIPWLSFRKGETEYAISWLPLGGYVKMATAEEDATSSALEGGAGDVVVPPDRYFEAKPLWKRMIVILAGVTMNVVFAVVVYFGIAWVAGRPVLPTTTVGRVEADSLPPGARELSQIRPGDRIVAVAGQPVNSWTDIEDRLFNASATRFAVQLADGRSLHVDVHADALEKRIAVVQSLVPVVTPVIQKIQEGSPAARAGLAPGDTMTAINGTLLAGADQPGATLDTNGTRPVAVTLRRNGVLRTVQVTPRLDTATVGDSLIEVPRIGVYFSLPIIRQSYSFGGAVKEGLAQTGAASTQIIRAVRGIATGRVSGRSLGGPILIAQQAGQQAQLGLIPFLAFMALISVNLAVLNLLPIPVLDGGQFLFLVAEAVIRRPLSLKLRERLIGVGLVMILVLMVYVFSNDIIRLVK